MQDDETILKQRRRESLFRLLDLLSDSEKQISFGHQVGDRVAIDELQCMWFDDQYHGDRSEFQKEYSKDELTALKAFNDYYNSLPKSIFGDSVIELTETNDWKKLMRLALETLAKMGDA